MLAERSRCMDCQRERLHIGEAPGGAAQCSGQLFWSNLNTPLPYPQNITGDAKDHFIHKSLPNQT